ncbi:NAD-dependent epimerase/dehydratase family protein [Chryseobacterium arthrosphaerae]|uniref:NAD-dependent epimerase/dehydratase family protein n=1 Tax=Chryseobacterium arthrosphaerae TaxID=651561 RepID=UPI0023E19176|nr:NAD-dependent epimerase/dehydratase family protein [Chryseobacterium arthrosphaerae]WES98745.1 NAD-dependent epimerase/dehydratase family protein [Chryseobacterium arthrosphaerae]
MVFVTGATGLLGRVIVLELLKQGKNVRAAKREQSNLIEMKESLRYYSSDHEYFFSKIDWINVDLSCKESIIEALVGVEEVYHCAGKVSYDPSEKREIFDFNVNITANILEASQSCKIRKFLYVSSSVIFQSVGNNGFITENSKLISDFDNTVYAISKLKAYSRVYNAMKNNLNIIIIHPGMIIGSGGRNTSSLQFLKLLTSGYYTFSGGTACVDVRDVAKIAVLLMKNNRFGEIFLIAAENKAYKDVSVMAGKQPGNFPIILNRTILTIARIPALFLRYFFPQLRLLTKENIRFLTSFPKVSNRKIVHELNYHFISIEESLIFHTNHFAMVEDQWESRKR